MKKIIFLFAVYSFCVDILHFASAVGAGLVTGALVSTSNMTARVLSSHIASFVPKKFSDFRTSRAVASIATGAAGAGLAAYALGESNKVALAAFIASLSLEYLTGKYVMLEDKDDTEDNPIIADTLGSGALVGLAAALRAFNRICLPTKA